MDVILATSRRRPALTESDALLRGALAGLGAAVRAAPWDQIAHDTGAVICLRSTWDYHLRVTEFRSWVSGFELQPGRLWNPPATVLGNIDKMYLEELGEAGIRIPPTQWLEAGSRPDLAALYQALSSPLVLKPRVSATAHGTHLVRPGDLLTEAQWEELTVNGALAQAFVPEVLSAGEISLVFIDGGFSHAARKLPRSGDFRVQSDFGGTSEACNPSGGVISFAESVLTAQRRSWLYARVDVVECASGPILMELELIEPHLFLDLAPDSAFRLARGLLRRGSGGSDSPG